MKEKKFILSGKKSNRGKEGFVADSVVNRGDNVNGFDPSDRKPDPERLLG
jgi:3-deoxy-D-arabino-heptulosonate 7-phosphate (DAHP) synthase class II